MALLVGTFFVQMRAKEQFRFDLMLIGATVQLIAGLGLYAFAVTSETRDPNHIKLGIHALVGIIVFVAALLGFLRQRRGPAAESTPRSGATGVGTTAPATVDHALRAFFHTAGGLAVINVLIAVFWR